MQSATCVGRNKIGTMFWSLVFWLFHILICPDTALSYLEEINSNAPTFLTASIGEYVVFNCPIDFPHDTVVPYSLRWKKENKTVFSWYEGVFTADDAAYAGRISLVPADRLYGRASVNLTNIRETDGGWYECTIIFPNRKPNRRPNGTWFHLTVEGGILLAIPPINVTTLEGSPAHFSCVTKDKEALVMWYKDGVPVDELQNLSARSTVDAEGSLTIRTTDMDDSGELHCVVSNAAGDKQAAGAFLNVQYKAKVIYSPNEIFLPYGRPGLLDCHFRANPPLTNLRWEKDGFLFDAFNVPGVFYRRNGSLYFSKVDETHSGRYTCTPFNELGTDGASPAVTVVVQRPPVFTVTPHSLYLRKLGDTLEMPCDAMDGEASHRPTIVWFRKDGAPLPSNRTRLLNGNLTIEQVVADDRGMYQCVASNEAATVSADTELVIENVAPRAPYNLSATATRNTVKLQWVAGFIRPNVEYSIWYRPVDTIEWRTTRVLARGSSEVTLNNLAPGRMYELMILGQDDRGDGMFSKAVRVKTKSEDEVVDQEAAGHLNSPLNAVQQIGPPRNIGVNLTSDGFTVHWEPPEFGAEDLRVYRVHWSQGAPELALGSVETRDTWWTVSPVDPGYTYYVQVTAISQNEYSATGHQLVVQMPGGDTHVRAISVGIASGVAILLIVAAAAVYFKRMHNRRDIKVDAS